MRIANIKAHLKKKFDGFVGSIEDENVKRLVEKNSIITGGCIVSLLTNEEVNDYDIYFQDRETALAVADYYIEEFGKRNPLAEEHVKIEELDDRIGIFIQSIGALYDKDLLRNEEGPVNDREDGLDIIPVIESWEYRPLFITRNAITLSNKIQLIIRFYGSPEEIHKSFDFIHCTCYYLPAEHKLVLPPSALESIITKELRYAGSMYPICSVIRTRKFIERGWTITGAQYLKMAYQISELDLNDIAVLEDQLTGVDAYYFTQMIEELRKEDSPDFVLSADYISTLVDRIFQ